MKLSSSLAILLLSIGVGVGMAEAEEAYPSKPIRMVIPFAPGGPTDVIARVVATRMQEVLGQPVLIENRLGAGGNIAITSVARAKPDGYTLLFSSSNIVSNALLYEKPPFDPLKDFAPVTYAAVAPNIIYVNPSVKANNVAELVELIKSSRGGSTYGTPGVGTTPHLACTAFALAANAEAIHVPYQGAAPVVTAALSNQVTMGCSALPPVTPHIAAQALRPIAVTSAKRSSVLPNVPTLAESGFPDVVADNMQAVLAPAGTPRPIIDKLYQTINAILKEPATVARLAPQGLDLYGTTPEEFTAIIRKEMAQYGATIKKANIKIE
jgi:tripartite-type tricarboxylate transporter receptor subunit TctC